MNPITLDQALQANGETDNVEFKQAFNVAVMGECLELIKDVAAIANSGGVNPFLAMFHGALSKIDARNDGQVLAYDAIIPGAALLGYANADHWAVALPFNRSPKVASRVFAHNNSFPREILAESIAKYVEESLLRLR